MTPTPAADPSIVVGLLDAFRHSKAMLTALSLGVFDKLHRQPASAADLASALGANPQALERLLNACTALLLLDKAGPLYSNAPVADTFLRRESPQTLSGYALHANRAMYPLWANLEDAVREGTNRWEQTFHANPKTLFEHFFRSEEDKRNFLAGMHGFGIISSPRVVDAFDLSRHRKLVDLGGATGHLVLAALDRYPDLEGTVFDLAPVIPVTREYLAGRGQAVAGDFFEDPLPPADLYALGRVLHDWTDERSTVLLRRIHDALPTGGGLLIAEKLLDEDRLGPLSALAQDLNMLVVTEGRERTATEFTQLLQASGFGDIQARRTGAPVDALYARK